MSSIRVTFPTDDAAVSALEGAGFSVGRLQASSPRGVMFGDFDIQKWRNLRPGDKESLDGHLCRHGPPGSPASVTIHSAGHIPAKAINQVVDAARAAQS
jgi:hypothetical protein